MLDVAESLVSELGAHDPSNADPRVLLCYVSGLDLRRVAPGPCPFLSSALVDYPWVPFRNLPSNELFPTLVTGVSPSEHGVWGVKIKPPQSASLGMRVWSSLPDSLTTTVQGLLHFTSGIYDLAAIPPRRRQRFEITRTKYKRRNKRPEAMFQIGGIPTIFDIVGQENSRYVFDSSLDPASKVLPGTAEGDFLFDVLELYSLDRFQQFNLDQPAKVQDYYTLIDTLLRDLHRQCAADGRLLILVSDHGHEPIRDSIDIASMLKELDLPDDSYDCFIEVSNIRFWFHDQKAANAINRMLRTLEHGTTLGYRQMAELGVRLDDESYGEVFCYLDPGYIFFPHDFHHPLANLWLGLSDPIQRSRLRDPRHKGNHGHLAHFETERSFIALLDDGFEPVKDQGDVLDVAPSILSALGHPPPSTMRGQTLFRRSSAA